MKIRTLMVLPLAATLMAPAFAQSAPSNAQSQSAATSQTNASSDQNLSAHQPLTPDSREGFWGKLNPFARKKYVQRQMSPIRDRVNELDELTATNTKNIKDVDSRAQEGIRMANAKATEADQHAIDAGNKAQQANQTAQMATARLQTVEKSVTSLDQYSSINDTEIRFRAGQTLLSAKAKEALDQVATQLKDQRGYIVEVQGFAPGGSQASVANSQRMAQAVVRYLVVNHEIPVYRIYTLGMGNAQLASTSAPAPQEGEKPYKGARVQVSVLKNSGMDSLNTQADASTPNSAPGAIGANTSAPTEQR